MQLVPVAKCQRSNVARTDMARLQQSVPSMVAANGEEIA